MKLFAFGSRPMKQRSFHKCLNAHQHGRAILWAVLGLGLAVTGAAIGIHSAGHTETSPLTNHSFATEATVIQREYFPNTYQYVPKTTQDKKGNSVTTFAIEATKERFSVTVRIPTLNTERTFTVDEQVYFQAKPDHKVAVHFLKNSDGHIESISLIKNPKAYLLTQLTQQDVVPIYDAVVPVKIEPKNNTSTQVALQQRAGR